MDFEPFLCKITIPISSGNTLLFICGGLKRESRILIFSILYALEISKMVQNPKIGYQHKPPFMPNKMSPTFRKLEQNCGFFVNSEISQKFNTDPV